MVRLVLTWRFCNGCPWGPKTCANAARGNHLEVLQWTQANGCPWNSDTFFAGSLGAAAVGKGKWLPLGWVLRTGGIFFLAGLRDGV
jgi:hypothetical protein